VRAGLGSTVAMSSREGRQSWEEEERWKGYEKVLVGKRARVVEPKNVSIFVQLPLPDQLSVSTCGTAVLRRSPVESLCDHQPMAICSRMIVSSWKLGFSVMIV
jgi:hypothetical protein